MRLIAFLIWSLAFVARAEEIRLKADETIVFYPGIVRQISGTDEWEMEVRGRIFEPEERGFTISLLRRALNLADVELTAEEEKIFTERARLFLVDHERGKKIFIRVEDKNSSIGKSASDGKFSDEIRLPASAVEGRSRIEFQAALRADDERVLRGEAFVLEETGLSVISDIDDTIKISNVRDRNKLLRNTFTREFEPVEGMAEFYQRLARSNHSVFHYVSASPWQLFVPLAEFVETNGFPRGTFSLKEFRWKNRTFLSLFADPEKYKPRVIEPLLRRFPKRKFILIGDSGERDPEVYAALARKFPEQIQHIYIRDVTSEPASASRYQRLFEGLPRDLWTVFESVSELKE